MPSPDAPRMSPQTALESAVLEAVRTLGYGPIDSGRMYDGRPPAMKSGLFLAVWSRGERRSVSRTSLDEEFGAMLTLTVAGGKRPRDRWHELRDDLHLRLDAVRALLHMDSIDHRVIRAANVLMGREPTDGTAPSPARRVGFMRGFMYAAMGEVQDRGADWFGGKGELAGFSADVRLEGARLVQATATAG